MAKGKAAWGIEVGAYEIKAIRLEDGGETGVEVTDFDVIRHKKVLTTPDLDQNEVIRLSLGQLISEKKLDGETLVMSVPGNAAFARFAKLPPVEPKKVPDIVKFEAVQQIPFPIETVEWDYETFMTEGSPEIEVGIFAITRDRVHQQLDMYGEVGLSPEVLTLSPVSLFNAMYYDHDLADREDPLVYIDIGTMSTDVVIADQGRCWIRTFPLGGTHFTEAIAEHFKLSYGKAEKLKMETSTSKYAKNIMGAMRPVFTNLLNDLQSSLNYFRSSHPGRELTDMIGAGSTFKIPGLRRFVGQQLQVEVSRLDEFSRISVPGREAATFAEHNVSMGTAYGLAMQGIGRAPIDINLVPTTVLREQVWHRKTRWFVGAAALAVVAGGVTFVRPILDQAALDANPIPGDVKQVESVDRRLKGQLNSAIAAMSMSSNANHLFQLFDFRSVWPHVVNDVAQAALSANPGPQEMSPDEAIVLEIVPDQRRLVEVDRLDASYVGPQGREPATIEVSLLVRLTHDEPVAFLNDTMAKWLREHQMPSGDRAAVPYQIENVQLRNTEISRSVIQGDGSMGEARSESRDGEGRRAAGGSGGGRRSAGGGRRAAGGGGGGGEARPPRRDDSGNRQQSGGGNRPSGGGTPSGGSNSLAGAGGAGGFFRPTGSETDDDRNGQQRSGGPPRNHQGQTQESVRLEGPLDDIAPLPQQPKIYPVGTKVVTLPITFTLKLIDPDAGGSGGSGQASAGARGGAS